VGEDELMALGSGCLGALGLGIALIPLRALTSSAGLALVFMALVVVVARWGGGRAAIGTTLASVLSLDFFLTRPYLELQIVAKEDIVAFCGLGLCGLMVAAFGRAARF
jgi:K+-sensing histidine kinase KdpD